VIICEVVPTSTVPKSTTSPGGPALPRADPFPDLDPPAPKSPEFVAIGVEPDVSTNTSGVAVGDTSGAAGAAGDDGGAAGDDGGADTSMDDDALGADGVIGTTAGAGAAISVGDDGGAGAAAGDDAGAGVGVGAAGVGAGVGAGVACAGGNGAGVFDAELADVVADVESAEGADVSAEMGVFGCVFGVGVGTAGLGVGTAGVGEGAATELGSIVG